MEVEGKHHVDELGGEQIIANCAWLGLAEVLPVAIVIHTIDVVPPVSLAHAVRVHQWIDNDREVVAEASRQITVVANSLDERKQREYAGNLGRVLAPEHHHCRASRRADDGFGYRRSLCGESAAREPGAPLPGKP